MHNNFIISILLAKNRLLIVLIYMIYGALVFGSFFGGVTVQKKYISALKHISLDTCKKNHKYPLP